jgi:hypothetical protein
MTNEDLSLPENLWEALLSGARRMLFPEAGETDGLPGAGSALKRLEDSGLAHVRELAEELAGLLKPQDAAGHKPQEPDGAPFPGRAFKP